jgi:sugar fermentation stimulation protein A
MKFLMEYGKPLIKGKMIDRPNRFTIRAKMGLKIEKVYLQNPGKLSTVISPGAEILCERAMGGKRKTRFSAFAIKVGKSYVMVNSSLANTIFSNAIESGAIREFRGSSIVSRERSLPAFGRIDFVLNDRDGKPVYVEVKSCTHVEGGIAKFPDRRTERGRRHLRALTDLASKGARCHIVFVVQRPDAKMFKPFRDVDPGFADMLEGAAVAGVRIGAIATKFVPPNRIYIVNENLPVEVN